MKKIELKNIALIILIVLNLLLLNNYLYKTEQLPTLDGQYESPLNLLLEHKQINPVILHTDNGESASLLEISSNPPKLVVYIQSSVCRPCLIEFIRTFEEILRLNIIPKQQVCIISNFNELKDFKAFAKSSFDGFQKYNGKVLLNDQEFIPTGIIMFILDDDMKIKMCYSPENKNEEEIKRYLSVLKSRRFL